jgi:hypothetical protein
MYRACQHAPLPVGEPLLAAHDGPQPAEDNLEGLGLQLHGTHKSSTLV